MQQRIFRYRKVNFKHKKHYKMALTILYWPVVLIALLQQLKPIDAAKFKGDSCVSKNQPGICREWGECTIIKTLIDSGEYTNREVVSCGFGVREELICCPVQRMTTTETRPVTDKSGSPESTITTTTQSPVRDFWMDLLETTTTSATSTAVPDFWLELLNPTTSTTTTTTTSTTTKPLVVGDQRLNHTSEFFDFNALLVESQSGGAKQERQTNPGNIGLHSNQPSPGFVASNGNGRGNLHTGPVNINHWSFSETEGNFNSRPGFNNGRGHHFRGNGNGNGNGNIGWGQQNINRGHNMGRGSHNNGRFRNNQNQGFIFSENNARPNNIFDNEERENHRPDRPVNNMQEQNPLTFNNNHEQTNKAEEKNIENLIKNVFENSNTNSEPSEAAVGQEKPGEVALETTIANVFNTIKPQNPNASPSLDNPSAFTSHRENSQPVGWITAPAENNNREVEFVQFHTPQSQVELINPPAPVTFEVISVADSQTAGNDLDLAPSTSFIQQPAVIETWPATRPDFNPAQAVYENLVNSGMDITKAHESHSEHIFTQPQVEHFIPQVVVVQPQPSQQPQFFPQHTQNFPQVSQQLIQQPIQMESSGKEPRSTPLQHQFFPQPHSGTIFNVQSPPTHILDPFKPFQFRPPPGDEITFSEDNNSLSPNPTSDKPGPKTPTTADRPAVRACRRIEKGLIASLSQHILGGIPAELGEFPHMAAIGYSHIGGEDRPPYDIRCGGTLIDKRFVLTAAHCVSERGNVPSIVRLGVVNFSDPIQMSAAIDLRIKETYIHDDYLTRLTYNDIAILELERDVEYSEYVYPVCLYTDDKDPDTNIKLWVTGWGTVNTTTRTFSDILLKAPLHTSPLKNCNKSFTDYGINRRIPEGIIRTQLCAEDKDQIKDACQGDSGGPLNLVVDESYKNYRLVGVVSSGFSCASSTPGLYTRVAAFLDFIEKIVWPNGGD